MDTLFGISSGQAAIVDGIAFVTENYTISGATGTFSGGRVLVVATGMSAGSSDGTIDPNR